MASFASVAAAQAVDDASRNAARRLAQDGVASYSAGEYAKATDQLERAYVVLRVPSIALWSARALAKSGHLVEADERYLEATRLSFTAGDESIQKKAQSDARAEADALTPRIPTVKIELVGSTPAEVELRVDGALVPSSLIREPRPVNPGAHTVQGKRGAELVSATVNVEEGGRAQATLRFTAPLPAAPAAPPEPAPAPQASASQAPVAQAPVAQHGNAQRTAGWVSLGIGGVGLAVGGVTGILLVSKHSALDAYCNNGVCDPSKRSDVNSFNTLRTISGATLIAGAVVTGVGVTLLLTAPANAEHPSAQAYLGVSELGLRGRF
ncbi:MAG TPA: hypothetical protein VGI10_00845 [Polyangiaceae bacterium]|jgi:hypothetical protein